MIRIVTLEREYGCGAAEIARRLSDQLHWRLWDELLTDRIARLAHCERAAIALREERDDPLYYRLMKSFALGSYEGSPIAPVDALDAESIVRISERVVLEAADDGNCVIVGRGSQHFLRDREDTLRFFLYAPAEVKVRRLISEGKTRTDAQDLVKRVDSERAAFIKRYFQADWPNRSVYHAMINTTLGPERVVHIILSLLQSEAATIQTENRPLGDVARLG